MARQTYFFKMSQISVNKHYDWDLHFDKGSECITVSSAAQHHITKLFEEQFPDLSHLCSFRGSGYQAELLRKENYFIFYMNDNGAQLPLIDSFSKVEHREFFLDLFNVELQEYGYADLKRLCSSYFGFKCFAYIGELRDGKASWPNLSKFITEWLNDQVLPRMLELNARAVRRALKDAPIYNPTDILKGLCVLECETDIRQGTGFFLSGVGIVTCAHVLGKNTKIFFPDMISKKYEVEVISKNDEIDLAILQPCTPIKAGEFEAGSCDDIKQMDHIMVSGFPNYRIGDTGLIIPGLVTGFRTVSGIRRLLTNSPIVAGNSGGPVFNKDSKVIGIAVTGGDSFSRSHDTEDHGIIPVEALRFLS